MRISQILKDKFRFTSVFLTLVLGLGVCAVSISAQKAPDAPLAAADLDQCRNGAIGSEVPCTGGAWVNGNAGSSNSHWAENQFLAYRMKLSGLTPGATVHTLTIGYDIIHGGPHAVDYLGTFNATDTLADPCSGVAGCVLGSPTSTIPITADTLTVTNNINPNTGMPIVQLPGQFTMWGGNLLSFAYTAVNVGGGDTERTVTVTFTASVANPVIAWGGHVGWIGDWGVGNSAGGISGSPYHMRLGDFDGGGGNQDRSLSAAAVIASGAVFIVKQVETLDNNDAAVFAWPFTATANFGPTSFSLIDDNGLPGIDTQQSQTITLFGPGNTITVTETTGTQVGWTLSNVNCVESGLQDSTQNTLGPSASIIVQLGEVVTCTFTNTQLVPSAAMVSVGGRVTTASGMPISRVNVKLTDQNGNARSALTSNFGYYRFDEVEVGQTYVVSIESKRYQFAPRLISLSDELADLDFIAF
jgi:hypothetical protein